MATQKIFSIIIRSPTSPPKLKAISLKRRRHVASDKSEKTSLPSRVEEKLYRQSLANDKRGLTLFLSKVDGLKSTMAVGGWRYSETDLAVTHCPDRSKQHEAFPLLFPLPPPASPQRHCGPPLGTSRECVKVSNPFFSSSSFLEKEREMCRAAEEDIGAATTVTHGLFVLQKTLLSLSSWSTPARV